MDTILITTVKTNSSVKPESLTLGILQWFHVALLNSSFRMPKSLDRLTYMINIYNQLEKHKKKKK